MYKTHWKLIKDHDCFSNISASKYLYKMVLYSKRFYGGHVLNRNRLQSCMVLIFGEIEPTPWCKCLKVLLNDFDMHCFSLFSSKYESCIVAVCLISNVISIGSF